MNKDRFDKEERVKYKEVNYKNIEIEKEKIMKLIGLLILSIFLFSCKDIRKQTAEIEKLREETSELKQKIEELSEQVTKEPWEVFIHCNCEYKYRDKEGDYNSPIYENSISFYSSGMSKGDAFSKIEKKCKEYKRSSTSTITFHNTLRDCIYTN